MTEFLVNKFIKDSANIESTEVRTRYGIPSQGVEHQKDGFVIRRNAIETGVNVLTSLDTAEALVTSLENTDANCLSLIDIATIARR